MPKTTKQRKCKYGPRLSSGKCPRKPKTTKIDLFLQVESKQHKQKLQSKIEIKSNKMNTNNTELNKEENKIPYIAPHLLEMTPQELKSLADYVSLDVQIEILKEQKKQFKTVLSKPQKRQIKLYEEELFLKSIGQYVEEGKTEDEMNEEYLNLIPKLINGTTGKSSEYRIIELKRVIHDLVGTTIDEYKSYLENPKRDFLNYFQKKSLIIMSIYDKK